MAEFTYQDKRPINDILIPGNRPGVPDCYYWYYNVTVKDENDILLSGVEMYNSSGTKVATSNSGKISYYAGETTLNIPPSDTFTFKKEISIYKGIFFLPGWLLPSPSPFSFPCRSSPPLVILAFSNRFYGT